MKNNLINSLFTLLLLTGCNSNSTIYEKAIADFVQTDKKGIWTDLQFKVIAMGEPIDITLGDSIRILTDEFDKVKNERIATLNEQLKEHTIIRDKEHSSTMKQVYQKWIDQSMLAVDSLTKSTVTLSEVYKNGKKEEVLAKEILCKFAITPPTYNTRQEVTKTFILSANGGKCYRKMNEMKQ